jgi:hypothetical protein
LWGEVLEVIAPSLLERPSLRINFLGARRPGRGERDESFLEGGGDWIAEEGEAREERHVVGGLLCSGLAAGGRKDGDGQGEEQGQVQGVRAVVVEVAPPLRARCEAVRAPILWLSINGHVREVA